MSTFEIPAIGLFCFIVGFVVAVKMTPVVIDDHCENYGHYATEKYKLTCELKP